MAQDDITLNGGNGETEESKSKVETAHHEADSPEQAPEGNREETVEVSSPEEAVSGFTESAGEADAPGETEPEPLVSDSASSGIPVSGDVPEDSEGAEGQPVVSNSESLPEAEAPGTPPVDEPGDTESAESPVTEEEKAVAEEEKPVAEEENAVAEEEKPVAEEEKADLQEEDEEEGAEEEDSAQESIDLTELDKPALAALLIKELAFLQKGENLTLGVFRRLDGLLKDFKPILENFQASEQGEALEKFVAENGSDEGFEYRQNPETAQLEELKSKLKTERGKFFRQLDKVKEDNFNLKTSLLQRLRELVEEEESKESDDSNMKAGWQDFKKIQEEWRTAGNINSPHNGTLWATYNALVDRYFNIRNMFFELKELDRKRNAEVKTELCEKVEAIADSIGENGYTRQHLDEALHLFEEYKHVGPAPKEDQEKLWQRFKIALDRVYDAKRLQSGELRKQAAEVYEIKSKIYEEILPYTAFSSGSINDWNAKTKELLAYQAKWEEIKGGMPREEGKVLSKKFWSALKAFFNNKGEFFRQLEAKREVNLKAKTELCEQAEEILSQGEDSPQNTQRIIELQKKWKTIGQVPEKFKDSIFVRFKTACDAYFDKKRGKNQAVEKEFEQNLQKKQDLCDRIEEMAGESDANIEQLNAFKAEWKGIGFVPRAEMQNIQKRYIAAINKYVSAIGKLSSREKEIVLLQSEVDVVKGSDSDRNLYRKENDLRKKVTQLEENILLWQNNIQFFAKSKTSDKLKADFEKKIEKAEEQLAELKHQLKVLQEAF